MDRFSTGILAILAVAAPACGGGGAGRDVACADLAAAVNACLTAGGALVNPFIEPMCSATTCTGSRDEFIAYVTHHQCTEAMQYDSVREMVLQGCSFPATCTGVAYWMANWSTIMSVPDAIARCEAATCTGSKSEALQCIVALDPLTSTLEDLDGCMTDGGCPPFPLN